MRYPKNSVHNMKIHSIIYSVSSRLTAQVIFYFYIKVEIDNFQQPGYCPNSAVRTPV